MVLRGRLAGAASSDQWDLKVGRASRPPAVPPMGETGPSRFRGGIQWDVVLGAKAEMGPAPSGSVSRAAEEPAMAGGLCLPAVLCHLWLCLSRTAALRCHLVPLAQVGLGPSPGAPAVQSCEDGEVCHQTLLLVSTGPVLASFRSKGCTPAGQSTGVSQYRQPPEVSLTLYNHVCSTDLCNDWRTAAQLWNVSAGSRPPPSAVAPGSLRCPACAALSSCPEDSPRAPCPPRSHCYRGVLQLGAGNSSQPLHLWGCGSWAPCGLLGGFWTPGPMGLREACDEAQTRTGLDSRTARGGAAWPEAWLVLWAVLPHPCFLTRPWAL